MQIYSCMLLQAMSLSCLCYSSGEANPHINSLHWKRGGCWSLVHPPPPPLQGVVNLVIKSVEITLLPWQHTLTFPVSAAVTFSPPHCYRREIDRDGWPGILNFEHRHCFCHIQAGSIQCLPDEETWEPGENYQLYPKSLALFSNASSRIRSRAVVRESDQWVATPRSLGSRGTRAGV